MEMVWGVCTYSADRQLCRDRRDFDKRRGIPCTTCGVPGADSRVPRGDLRLSGAHSEGAARLYPERPEGEEHVPMSPPGGGPGGRAGQSRAGLWGGGGAEQQGAGRRRLGSVRLGWARRDHAVLHRHGGHGQPVVRRHGRLRVPEPGGHGGLQREAPPGQALLQRLRARRGECAARGWVVGGLRGFPVNAARALPSSGWCSGAAGRVVLPPRYLLGGASGGKRDACQEKWPPSSRGSWKTAKK